jgi:TetR/AcrR family transcriptional regulator, transcriptional repressor for nem operon
MTRRGRASRERIVERAAELFAERGIAGTSVDEVLAASGAGKGQFYHYFRGRDELAAAALGFRCTQVVAGPAVSRAGVGRPGALAAERGTFSLRLVAVRVAHFGTPAMWM